MNNPSHLKYTKDHEWINFEGKQAYVGITEHAVEQLGDIVHMELPEIGEEFDEGATFGTVESTKTVSDLFMPLAGKILEINDALLSDFSQMAEDPYDNGWIVRIAVVGDSESSNLMSANEYQAFIVEEGD